MIPPRHVGRQNPDARRRSGPAGSERLLLRESGPEGRREGSEACRDRHRGARHLRRSDARRPPLPLPSAPGALGIRRPAGRSCRDDSGYSSDAPASRRRHGSRVWRRPGCLRGRATSRQFVLDTRPPDGCRRPGRGFAFRRTARDPSLAAFARPPVPSPPGGRSVGAHHTRLREERRPTLVRRRRTLYRNSSRSALTPGTARVRSAAWVLVLASGALPNRVTTPLSERTLMSASLSPPSLPRRSFTAF